MQKHSQKGFFMLGYIPPKNRHGWSSVHLLSCWRFLCRLGGVIAFVQKRRSGFGRGARVAPTSAWVRSFPLTMWVDRGVSCVHGHECSKIQIASRKLVTALQPWSSGCLFRSSRTGFSLLGLPHVICETPRPCSPWVKTRRSSLTRSHELEPPDRIAARLSVPTRRQGSWHKTKERSRRKRSAPCRAQENAILTRTRRDCRATAVQVKE